MNKPTTPNQTLTSAIAELLEEHDAAKVLEAIADACDATSDACATTDRSKASDELSLAAIHARTAARHARTGDLHAMQTTKVSIAMGAELLAEDAYVSEQQLAGQETT